MVRHEMVIGSTIEVGNIKIRLDHKSGQRVSLVIDAPDDVIIKRPPKNNGVTAVKAKTGLTLA